MVLLKQSFERKKTAFPECSHAESVSCRKMTVFNQVPLFSSSLTLIFSSGVLQYEQRKEIEAVCHIYRAGSVSHTNLASPPHSTIMQIRVNKMIKVDCECFLIPGR